MCRPIFVAATRQNVGKTTVSLALMSGLRKRFGKVGFIKPVGQQHVPVTGSDGTVLRVDKDVVVMKEYFGLDNIPYEHMSPVLVPKGYTKQYIDGEVSRQAQVDRIQNSFTEIERRSDITLVEGTGHVGVGSIIEMSNAQTAALIGADVVLVANGGLGSAFDELEVNRVMCEHHGARLRGVIINKVLPEKLGMVKDYFGRVCEQRWGVPLLGVIDYLPLLSKPCLSDIEQVLGATLISGKHCRPLHYSTEDVEVVTTAPRRFLRKLRHRYDQGARRPIYLTHITRDDVVLAYLAFYQRVKQGRWEAGDDPTRNADRAAAAAAAASAATAAGAPAAAAGAAAAAAADLLPPVCGDEAWVGSLVLCTGDAGRPSCASNDDSAPLPYLLDLTESYGAPVMLTTLGTLPAYKAIQACSAKLHASDAQRVATAVAHYEPRIDFDKLLNFGRS